MIRNTARTITFARIWPPRDAAKALGGLRSVWLLTPPMGRRKAKKVAVLWRSIAMQNGASFLIKAAADMGDEIQLPERLASQP